MSTHLRCLLWTVRALRTVRGAAPGAVQPVPPPASAARVRTAALALRALRATCLQRCLVLQAVLTARGVDRDVVVGVGPGRTAHAWLDGEPPQSYLEILRYPVLVQR